MTRWVLDPHRLYTSSSSILTSRNKSPCIVVYGGGAVGSLFATLLTLSFQSQQCSHLLYILSTHLSHPTHPIQQHGLTVQLSNKTRQRLAATQTQHRRTQTHMPPLGISAGGSVHWSPRVVPDVKSVLHDPDFQLNGAAVDYVLLCVKGLSSIQQSAQQIARLLNSSPSACILPLMNGVAHLSILQKQFGSSVNTLKQRALLFASTAQGAHFLNPYTLSQAGDGVTQLVLPAVFPASLSQHKQMDDMLEWLPSACFPVNVLPASRLLSLFWTKLCVNCVINPLTALLSIKNGQLVQLYEQDGRVRSLIEQIVSEVCLVATHKDIAFDWELSSDQTDSSHAARVSAGVSHVLSVAEVTKDNVSSMWADIQQHRETEIECINGEIVQEAQQAGIQVPVNGFLVDAIKELQRCSVQQTTRDG